MFSGRRFFLEGLVNYDRPRGVDAYSHICVVGFWGAGFRRHNLGATVVVIATAGDTVFQGP